MAFVASMPSGTFGTVCFCAIMAYRQ